MRQTHRETAIQWVKDRVIASGAEPVFRPLWATVTGHRLAATDLDLSRIVEHVLRPDSVCIDIGAHKGLILDMCIRRARQGSFYAFEPLPYLAKLLRRKYRWNGRVTVYDIALSDKTGVSTFYVNATELGRSGLAKPDTLADERDAASCTVPTARLDDVLPDVNPTLIKIDVEGAELGVLRGAQNMLMRSKPIIVFEHGIGGADRFGAAPEDVFDLLALAGFEICPLSMYLINHFALSRTAFCDQFYQGMTANFVAYSTQWTPDHAQ